MKLGLSLLTVLVGSQVALADVDAKYFEIKQVRVREVSAPQIMRTDVAIGSIVCDAFTPQNSAGEVIANPGQALDAVEMILDKVINIGRKIWNLVVAGRPVSNLKTSVATALPAGARCWTDLENWKMPESKVYEVAFENGFGSEVVYLSYRVLWLPGGQVKGQGNYIGYATVQPVSISVNWGFELNAEVTIPTVFNMGSQSSPVGGMQVNMNYRVESIVTKIDEGQAFFINGLGQFKMLD